MRNLFIVLSIILSGLSVKAQTTGTLSGKIVDTVGKQEMKDATITLLDATDSTLEVFGLSKQDGSFVLNNISMGDMLLQIRFQGYESFTKKISFTAANRIIDLGTIYMQIAANDLGNVTVTQSPITIKKDTIEFNASSFKTKPNAVLEDLLKKLPGVEVDKDGGVKAQGEQVQRVLVDGKRFFGDDPKMATRNLPPDIIDKIQVFDALNDQSAFTGFDDGNRIKTINISTKKDKRKGYFGKGSVGAGASVEDGLYDNNLNLSRFNGDMQLTLVGQANNVNKQNFTGQDILGANGGGGGGGRGGNSGGNSGGIVNTWTAGLNYRDVWGKKTQFSGSYFFNNQKTYRDQTSYTQNLTSGNPDSSIYNRQTQHSEMGNQNNRLNLNIEHEFDSSNSMIIRSNLSFQHNESESEQTTFSTKGLSKSLNNSVATSNRISDGYNANIEATFRHRFKKKGRTYSIAFNPSKSVNDGNNYNRSVNSYFNTSTPYIDTINQHGISNRDANGMGATFSYTEPIGKNQLLELNYNYNSNINNSGTRTFAYNKLTNQYDKVVTNLTNVFDNTFNSNRVSLNYRLQNAKYNFSVGTGIQAGDLTSKNISKDSTLTQKYVNFFPTMNFRYDFTKTKNLRFFYNGRTSQPSASQLQPLIDNSNPLNIRTGNPALKQQFVHTFRFLFNSFDMFTQRLIFATVNANFTNNDIQNSTTFLPNGAQMTKPVNLNGTYNVNGNFHYGFPLKNPKSNVNLSVNLSKSQSQTLVNNQSNYTRNTSTGFNASWTTNLKDNFDMNFSSNSSFTFARYSLQPQQNGDYFTQNFSAEPTYYTKNGWILAADFNYIKNTGRSAGYNTSIPLLNASLSKQLFKKKEGELKFYVFDLLNQNVSISRNITGNIIQDVSTKVLTRYFMLSFTYNLRRFGDQGGNRQRGGMMDMYRRNGGERSFRGGGDMMRGFRQFP